MAVGLEETMDEEMINQGPEFIAHMVNELDRRGIPVVTPRAAWAATLMPWSLWTIFRRTSTQPERWPQHFTLSVELGAWRGNPL